MRVCCRYWIGANMKFVVVVLSVLVWPSVIFAAEDIKQPIGIERILQELRVLDSSMDTEGDHVVGEQMC